MKIEELSWEDLCAFFAMQGFLSGKHTSDAKDIIEHFDNIAAASYAMAERMKIERQDHGTSNGQPSSNGPSGVKADRHAEVGPTDGKENQDTKAAKATS
jgi:hypothetical protein